MLNNLYACHSKVLCAMCVREVFFSLFGFDDVAAVAVIRLGFPCHHLLYMEYQYSRHSIRQIRGYGAYRANKRTVRGGIQHFEWVSNRFFLDVCFSIGLGCRCWLLAWWLTCRSTTIYFCLMWCSRRLFKIVRFEKCLINWIKVGGNLSCCIYGNVEARRTIDMKICDDAHSRRKCIKHHRKPFSFKSMWLFCLCARCHESLMLLIALPHASDRQQWHDHLCANSIISHWEHHEKTMKKKKTNCTHKISYDISTFMHTRSDEPKMCFSPDEQPQHPFMNQCE